MRSHQGCNKCCCLLVVGFTTLWMISGRTWTSSAQSLALNDITGSRWQRSNPGYSGFTILFTWQEEVETSVLIYVNGVKNTQLLSECIQVWTVSAVIDLVWCHSVCMGTHLLHPHAPLPPQMSSSCITNSPISRQNLQMFYHIKSPTDSLHRFINTNCPEFMKRHYQ